MCVCEEEREDKFRETVMQDGDAAVDDLLSVYASEFRVTFMVPCPRCSRYDIFMCIY